MFLLWHGIKGIAYWDICSIFTSCSDENTEWSGDEEEERQKKRRE
jgi:hypothetical protein